MLTPHSHDARWKISSRPFIWYLAGLLAPQQPSFQTNWRVPFFVTFPLNPLLNYVCLPHALQRGHRLVENTKTFECMCTTSHSDQTSPWKCLFEDILPNTCEIVLNWFVPLIDGGDPIPILILLKFLVCNFSMMLFSPLCPPELPFFLNLIFPRGRSLSSTIIKIWSKLILYQSIIAWTASPLLFI